MRQQIWFKSFKKTEGGEIYVPKLKSFRIIDLAKAINPKTKLKFLELELVKKFMNRWFLQVIAIAQ